MERLLTAYAMRIHAGDLDQSAVSACDKAPHFNNINVQVGRSVVFL
jgi:hypothetical protein